MSQKFEVQRTSVGNLGTVFVDSAAERVLWVVGAGGLVEGRIFALYEGVSPIYGEAAVGRL